MTDITEVQRFTDAIISLIREDQGSGQIPRDVLSVDELDNYVDVDDYYRRIGLAAGDHDGTELRCAVDDELGRRLASTQGGPWQVMWRPREGTPQNIGRTVGYATQAEAQAIGREYVRTHEGGFHLRRE